MHYTKLDLQEQSHRLKPNTIEKHCVVVCLCKDNGLYTLFVSEYNFRQDSDKTICILIQTHEQKCNPDNRKTGVWIITSNKYKWLLDQWRDRH